MVHHRRHAAFSIHHFLRTQLAQHFVSLEFRYMLPHRRLITMLVNILITKYSITITFISLLQLTILVLCMHNTTVLSTNNNGHWKSIAVL